MERDRFENAFKFQNNVFVIAFMIFIMQKQNESRDSKQYRYHPLHTRYSAHTEGAKAWSADKFHLNAILALISFNTQASSADV